MPISRLFAVLLYTVYPVANTITKDYLAGVFLWRHCSYIICQGSDDYNLQISVRRNVSALSGCKYEYKGLIGRFMLCFHVAVSSCRGNLQILGVELFRFVAISRPASLQPPLLFRIPCVGVQGIPVSARLLSHNLRTACLHDLTISDFHVLGFHV